MASGALGDRPFRGGLLVRQWMMPISEKTPAVRLFEALAVFYGHVDAVVRTVEITASGRFLTRAVWERWVKNPGQFFYYDRSFWGLACFQVCRTVVVLDIYVRIFA